VSEMKEKVRRLEEIQEEMLSLLDEARGILEGTRAYSRADAYWLAHVKIALTNEHDYLGESMCSMEDTIEELMEEAESESVFEGRQR